MPKTNKAKAPTPVVKSSAEIAAELETLRDNLTKIIATIDLIGKPAEAKAAEINAAIAYLQEQFAQALANEAETERQARLAGFGSITITKTYPPGYEGNLLRANFAIAYERLQYDMRARASVMQAHKVVGFDGLPAEVLEYLIAAKPDAIPAEIRELAPGDPLEAFRRYFIGKRKGYLRTYAEAA